MKDEEYYNALDKRTAEYKEWKATQNIQPHKTQEELEERHKKLVEENTIGLGDVVDKITTVTGIKSLVEFVAGEDCGCDERKEKWNKNVHLRRKTPLCLTEKEFEILDRILNTSTLYRKNGLTHPMQTELLSVYNRIFKVRKPQTSCNGCMASVVIELEAVYEAYK